MWWQQLIPAILEIVRLILERRLPPPAVRPAMSGVADAEAADRLAAQLETALAGAPKAADPLGHDGGVIQHVQELIAALKARDWPKVIACITDLLSHL